MAAETLRDEPKPAKDFCSKFEIVSYTFDISKSKKIWPLEKLKRRSLALLNRIELEYFSTNLFMLNALPEYDMFMGKFGYSDTTQAASQTRKDDCEVDVSIFTQLRLNNISPTSISHKKRFQPSEASRA